MMVGLLRPQTGPIEAWSQTEGGSQQLSMLLA